MEEKDKFDLEFEKQTEILVNCQKNFGFKSCSECEKILDCKTRDDYVKATYESMSKGQTGGFDF